MCAAFGFSLHFAQWPRERENLVELQIFLQIKSKGMSALRTCKRMDYSTIGILPELYYTNSNISFTKLDVITKTPILSSISPHPSWCDGVCACVCLCFLTSAGGDTCISVDSQLSTVSFVYPLTLKIGRKLLNWPHHCCYREPVAKDK